MGLLPSDVCSMSCDDKVSVCPSHTHLFVDIICFTILTIHAHYYITEMARHCLVTNVPTPAVVVSRPGGCPSVSQREEFSPPFARFLVTFAIFYGLDGTRSPICLALQKKPKPSSFLRLMSLAGLQAQSQLPAGWTEAVSF